MAKKAKNESVRRAFGSLINNATAIEGAKYSPWWIGVVMLILGLLLPVLPLFVSAAKTNGTSFMKSCEYGLGMDKTFGVAINDLDGLLTFNNSEKTINYQPNSTYSEADSTLIGGYVSNGGVTNGQYDLRIYYSTITGEEQINNFISEKHGIVYKKGTTQVASVNEEGYTPSTVYFFQKTFFVEIFASNSTTPKAKMSILADMNCLDYADGNLKTYFCGASFNKDNNENKVAALNNLKTLIDDTYKTAKTKQMWLGSLIYLGVYAAINLFMMLMIFLMSRGKNNPNNYLTFWTCMKIGMWICFCPGLLGMILGFIFPGNAMMLYVMLIAMRTMWLTMRELRPQY